MSPILRRIPDPHYPHVDVVLVQVLEEVVVEPRGKGVNILWIMFRCDYVRHELDPFRVHRDDTETMNPSLER